MFPDIPETSHPELNAVLNASVKDILAFEAHRQHCESMQVSNDQCDECVRTQVKAQDSKRLIFSFIDEHYMRVR